MIIQEAKLFKAKAQSNAKKYCKDGDITDYLDQLLIINAMNKVLKDNQ